MTHEKECLQKTVKFGTFPQLTDFIFALKFEKDFKVSKKTKTLKFNRDWEEWQLVWSVFYVDINPCFTCKSKLF